MHGRESYSHTAMSKSSPASKQLNPCCCMSIAAASFTRFSCKACRASGEMLFPVRSKGMNESFMESLSFFFVLLVSTTKGTSHLFSHHAAAGLHILPRHPACSVAGKKSGHICHFLWRAYAIERRQARAVCAVLFGEHVRVCESR